MDTFSSSIHSIPPLTFNAPAQSCRQPAGTRRPHRLPLADAALDLLATIVRGADTDRLDLSPQSAGLLALSLGLSRLHATDDHAMLEAAMPLYDALYAWCRDRVGAQDEPHSWKPETMVGAPG